MAIPHAQLLTWSKQGAVSTASTSYELIQKALNEFIGWPVGTSYEVYLQGSYKNDTNIRGDSDVDVVVELSSAHYRDLSGLSNYEQTLYLNNITDSTYLWGHFRTDVKSALTKYYGSAEVAEGKKSLKVKGSSWRLPVDVVVCFEHRKFSRYYGETDQKFIKGITFFVPNESRWVVNYPKQHYDNGIIKNRITNGRFKPTVRLFKNIRTHLVSKGKLGEDIVPSHLIESLLYNVPYMCFKENGSETFVEIMNWFVTAFKQRVSFKFQHEQGPLFGTDPEQWEMNRAYNFLLASLDLWNNWSG